MDLIKTLKVICRQVECLRKCRLVGCLRMCRQVGCSRISRHVRGSDMFSQNGDSGMIYRQGEIFRVTCLEVPGLYTERLKAL